MTEILGPSDIANLALPDGIDAGVILKWMLKEGVTFEQFLSATAQALGSFNSDMVNLWGWSFSITDQLYTEYEQGGAVTELPEITDYTVVDEVHGDTIGHMLPIRSYGGALGGTWMYFRDTRQAKIVASIRRIVLRARKRFEKKLLTRLCTDTETVIGSAGYDVPFVNGGRAQIDFIPPSYDGVDFASSHDHFVGVDSDTATRADMIEAMAAHLYEHGHLAPYRLTVSSLDVSAFSLLANWVKVVSSSVQMIDMGGATSGPQLFMKRDSWPFFWAGEYNSTKGLVEVYQTSRIPTGYANMVKTYGTNNNQNPLKVRVRDDVGFGMYVVPEASDRNRWPIKKLTALMEFGIGMGEDRTNGVNAQFSSAGTWTNPVIS